VNHSRQIAALAVTSGVAVASLVGTAAADVPAASHHAVKTSRPTAAAAGYLARQLVGRHHDHYDGTFVSGKKTITYVNYGETADGILSMDAAGVAQTAAARATRYLKKHVHAYAGHSVATYAPGPIGKLLLVAEAQHLNVHNFGGLDLVAAIASTEGIRGAAAGEYQQNPMGTKTAFLYFSTVSQALGVLGLANTANAPGQPDSAAVDFLAAQQCKGGGYPTELEADPATACKAGKDVDSTGYAVQALIAAGDHQAAARSVTWLEKVQHHNGGFGSPANANSTALALQALRAAHESITVARGWLRVHQLGCSAKPSRRGAITFQKGYDASALLATSQAGAALADLPLDRIDKAGARAAAPVLRCSK
jgi:hypothetical protein